VAKKVKAEFVDPETGNDEEFHDEFLDDPEAIRETAREAIRRAMKEDGLSRKEAEELYLPRKEAAP
jgi:hypothetical protein